MHKHKVYKYTQLWYGLCGRCSYVYTSKFQTSVWTVLEQHCQHKHAGVASVDA